MPDRRFNSLQVGAVDEEATILLGTAGRGNVFNSCHGICIKLLSENKLTICTFEQLHYHISSVQLHYHMSREKFEPESGLELGPLDL